MTWSLDLTMSSEENMINFQSYHLHKTWTIQATIIIIFTSQMHHLASTIVWLLLKIGG